jgi:vacuolar-type H+-ATPase subunit I/STV1
MAKRRPVSFPELDAPRGKGAILRSTEEVEAEQQLLENQEAGHQANKLSVDPELQNARNPESQQSGSRAEYTKATYRLSPEALEAIDDAKRILRRRYQAKVSLEEIAEEAILAAYRDLLDNQQSSMLANKFSGSKHKP